MSPSKKHAKNKGSSQKWAATPPPSEKPEVAAAPPPAEKPEVAADPKPEVAEKKGKLGKPCYWKHLSKARDGTLPNASNDTMKAGWMHTCKNWCFV